MLQNCGGKRETRDAEIRERNARFYIIPENVSTVSTPNARKNNYLQSTFLKNYQIPVDKLNTHNVRRITGFKPGLAQAPAT